MTGVQTCALPIYHALIERTVPRELKIFFLAIIGIGDGADGQDDFNQSVLHSKDCLSHITSNSSPRFKFRPESRRANSFAASQPLTGKTLKGP